MILHFFVLFLESSGLSKSFSIFTLFFKFNLFAASDYPSKENNSKKVRHLYSKVRLIDFIVVTL